MGVVAVGTYAMASKQHEQWTRDRQEVLGSERPSEQWADLADDAARIQALDDAAVVATVAGSAALVGAVAYWFWGADPDRFRKHSSGKGVAWSARRWEW